MVPNRRWTNAGRRLHAITFCRVHRSPEWEAEMISRRLTAGVMAAGALVGVFLAPGVACADKVKDCGTSTTVVGPGKSGMTQTTTETQTSACHSNSDTGEQTTTGPVTNRGGGT